MAEEQQGEAQNKLGQLYVELGAKGLGGLVKGLNGLSAQFLLTKNAAQQAVKPIVNMSMNAANTVTGWDKLNAVMGLTLQDIQKIYRFTGLNNIDFNSFMGQLKNVQQKIFDIRAGMSDEGVKGMAILGLQPFDFDPRKPLEFLDEVKKRIQTVDEVQAAAALRYLGLSEDLLYVWKQQNNDYDERLNLSDKELENLKEQQSAWNSLKVTWQSAQQKFISNQMWINSLLNAAGRLITDMVNQHYDWQFGAEQSGFYKFLAKIGQTIGDIKTQFLKPDAVNAPKQITEVYYQGDTDIIKRYNEAKAAQDAAFNEDKKRFKQGLKTPAAGNIYANQKKDLMKITGAKPLNEETKTSASAVLPPLPNAEPSKPMQFLPPDIKRDAQYTVIQNIEQYIQGEDSRQIAEDVNEKLTNNISEYNKYLPAV